MGGVGVPQSYFDIANFEFKRSCAPAKISKSKPTLVFLVVGGDASGKTTIIDNLIKKFTYEYDINPISKAPINPLELHDKITSNKVVFIDVHEFNQEMSEWIDNINSLYKNDYGFILIHPHVSMETYRKRVTQRLLNNSLELRFGIPVKLFECDILRHIKCAQSLHALKPQINNLLDIGVIYENNTPHKEIVNIFSKKYDYVYKAKLLDDVFNKEKLDKNKEITLAKSFYHENSPYNDLWGDLDYSKLVQLKEKNSTTENPSPFFPPHLNDAFDAICTDYATVCHKEEDKNYWFPSFDKFATQLQDI